MQRTTTNRYSFRFLLLETCSLLQETAPSAKQVALTEEGRFPVRLNLVAAPLAVLIAVLYLCTCPAFSDPPVLLFDNNHSSAVLSELWMGQPILLRKFHPAESLLVLLLT
jgi:hypothetical protein